MPPPARWSPGALALLGLGAALLLVVASFHSGWLIDDAGISLAYARNFAAGHGLVHQPLADPVEGYSNPSWVLLLALCYRLSLMSLPASVKALSLVCLTLSVAALHRAARLVVPEVADWVTAGTVLLSAGNISVVLWCFSGLENPLYLTLVMITLALTIEAGERPDTPHVALSLGIASGLLVWTRPDGLAFALLPLATYLARGLFQGKALWPAPRWVSRYLGTLALGTGSLFLWRRLYFGFWMPNTFLVKGGVGAAELLQVALLQPDVVEKALTATSRLLGSRASHPVLLLTVGAMIYGARSGRWQRRHDALPVFTLGALAVFLLMPSDWMIETRFATAFYPLAYTVFLVLIAEAGATLPSAARGRIIGWSALILGAFAAPEGYYRILSAAGQGNVGISLPARAYGERFNRAAQLLQLENGILAVQDLGGTLLTSHLRVVDIAGLCDRTVARTLDKDSPTLREYLFGEVRPDFLVLQGGWARSIAVDEDPRFRRDYLPLHEHAEGEPGFAEGHPAGVYLKKSLVHNRPQLLAQLRSWDHRLVSFDREPDRGPIWPWFLRLPLPHPAPERLRHPTASTASIASSLRQHPAS